MSGTSWDYTSRQSVVVDKNNQMIVSYYNPSSCYFFSMAADGSSFIFYYNTGSLCRGTSLSYEMAIDTVYLGGNINSQIFL
jgi:hypothetical protein